MGVPQLLMAPYVSRFQKRFALALSRPFVDPRFEKQRSIQACVTGIACALFNERTASLLSAMLLSEASFGGFPVDADQVITKRRKDIACDAL